MKSAEEELLREKIASLEMPLVLAAGVDTARAFQLEREIEDAQNQLAKLPHSRQLPVQNSVPGPAVDTGQSAGTRPDGFLDNAHDHVPAQSSESALSATEASGSPNEVVLLIHGIRTQAAWQRTVKNVLEEISGVFVQESNYGYFDAFRFWCPVFTRNSAIEEVGETIQELTLKYPNAKLSVIAHSNGTYIITRLFQSQRNLEIHRLVLCGSIVRRRYPWHTVNARLDKDVVNDYGTRDFWPFLAKALSWGYGDTGRHRFGKPSVRDRGHDFGHSDYFGVGTGQGEEFVRKFWKPWFADDTWVDSGHVKPSPWLLSILSILPLQWLAIIFFALLGVSKLLSPDHQSASATMNIMGVVFVGEDLVQNGTVTLLETTTKDDTRPIRSENGEFYMFGVPHSPHPLKFLVDVSQPVDLVPHYYEVAELPAHDEFLRIRIPSGKVPREPRRPNWNEAAKLKSDSLSTIVNDAAVSELRRHMAGTGEKLGNPLTHVQPGKLVTSTHFPDYFGVITAIVWRGDQPLLLTSADVAGEPGTLLKLRSSNSARDYAPPVATVVSKMRNSRVSFALAKLRPGVTVSRSLPNSEAITAVARLTAIDEHLTRVVKLGRDGFTEGIVQSANTSVNFSGLQMSNVAVIKSVDDRPFVSPGESGAPVFAFGESGDVRIAFLVGMIIGASQDDSGKEGGGGVMCHIDEIFATAGVSLHPN